jgi:hypothetical protein
MVDGAGTPSPRITCVLTRDAVHGLPGVRGRKERACALFHLTVEPILTAAVKVVAALHQNVLMSAEQRS